MVEKKISETAAKQGRKGTHVLTILIVALVLAAIVWWAVGIYGGAIEPENPVGGAPTEQSGGEAPPAAPQPDQPAGPATSN
jgi:hypothetical protein